RKSADRVRDSLLLAEASGSGREYGRLVHGIASETVELLGQHVARRGWIPRWQRDGLAVQGNAFECLRLLVLERDLRPVESRAEPAAQEPRLRVRPAHADGVDVGDARPERRQVRAPP